MRAKACASLLGGGGAESAVQPGGFLAAGNNHIHDGHGQGRIVSTNHAYVPIHTRDRSNTTAAPSVVLVQPSAAAKGASGEISYSPSVVIASFSLRGLSRQSFRPGSDALAM